MNHLDDDTLLKLALALMEPEETSAAQAHLAACAECRARLNDLQRDMADLSSIRVEIPAAISQPQPKRTDLASWKIAAVLLIGCLAGWGTSQWLRPGHVRVIHEKFSARAAMASQTHLAPADALAAR
jgi:hypothetical protein